MPQPWLWRRSLDAALCHPHGCVREAHPPLKATRVGKIFVLNVPRFTTRDQHRLVFAVGCHNKDVTFANIDTDGRLTRRVGVVLNVERTKLIRCLISFSS
jgi:hypothetical protein